MQLVASLQQGQAAIGAGLDRLSAHQEGAVLLQGITLRTLIALAGVWNISPEALTELVRGVTDERIQEYVRGLKPSEGKA